MSSGQLRRICITVNNYSVDDFLMEPLLYGAMFVEKRVSSFVCGREVGENGTPHLQGYFEVESSRGHSIVAMQKWSCFKGYGVSMRPADGTAEQNIKYCTKDGDSVRWGMFTQTVSRRGQGKRTDWEIVRSLAKLNSEASVYADEVPHLAFAHINKISAWNQIYDKRCRVSKTRPIIFYGPPRSGKSTRARELAGEESVYFKSDPEKWWPFYNGEKIIVIDEMHGGYFQYQQLLKFFEEGSYQVQIKGSTVQFLGEVVYMTTNVHPARWYKERMWDESNAFRARIEEFGELWCFAPRYKADGQWVYPAPVRDVDLLDPIRAMPTVLHQNAAAAEHVEGLRNLCLLSRNK